ncbi:Histidine kinase-, DNA gyrase B-, and HSP90-like ATPase [Tangfeifania diversioriginum]|uniref:histidine kinase n=1 Tax=Tangfeifania diversioriginum TaxID=1168035 RepID=A0A1M6P1Q4_9BACT|nr:HAMP domain-containing sensor histidine kinase [Tangfeifania diversioriginum]SHK01830.1 Histidine kinase-, DNA gyrase B-, and HSP90-like ATPase [Tangfeifania diversioriginum]
MDIYLKRKRGKILLLLSAIIIGVASLLYTNWLTEKMAREERKKVELWAEATRRFAEPVIESTNEAAVQRLNTSYLTLLQEIAEQNTTIPIIIVDENGDFNTDANINYNESRREQVLKNELEKMKGYSEPIPIVLSHENTLYLYYRESNILRNLRYYPVVQLFVIIIFIIVAYFAFDATQRAEQNQVWVGMSKETAHQLGTPISSLMAWIELLKMQNVDPALIDEFESDTKRLEKITERFSKIGSKPELLATNLVEVLLSTVSYLKTRSSEKVKFEMNFSEGDRVEAPLNAALFSWVVENLCKNAIDAMDNNGKITFSLQENGGNVLIDITDTGKGVPKSQQKTIFQPGFSTKKRGWGLGLSLAKRIIEIYHSGKIFIKWSEAGKGTTFRIILNK